MKHKNDHCLLICQGFFSNLSWVNAWVTWDTWNNPLLWPLACMVFQLWSVVLFCFVFFGRWNKAKLMTQRRHRCRGHPSSGSSHTLNNRAHFKTALWYTCRIHWQPCQVGFKDVQLTWDVSSVSNPVLRPCRVSLHHTVMARAALDCRSSAKTFPPVQCWCSASVFVHLLSYAGCGKCLFVLMSVYLWHSRLCVLLCQPWLPSAVQRVGLDVKHLSFYFAYVSITVTSSQVYCIDLKFSVVKPKQWAKTLKGVLCGNSLWDITVGESFWQ